MRKRVVPVVILFVTIGLVYLGISGKVFDFKVGKANSQFMVLKGSSPVAPSLPAGGGPLSPERIYGKTRYETSKAIAESFSTGMVENVVLVSGNGFSDALSATDLAHKLNAPVLLANSTPDGSQEAFDYLKKHLEKNGHIFLIGGTGVMGTDFEESLRQMGYADIKRIGGRDRYDTGVQVNELLHVPKGTPVVLASGENYPDALSISSIAAYHGWPILLVPPTSIPPEVQDFLEDVRPSKLYIIGGEGAVSLKSQVEIRTALPNTEIQRLSGVSRFDTAAQILQAFAPNPKAIYLASGYDFADALSGSAVASKTGDPIVLVDPELVSLPLPIDIYISQLANTKSNPAVIALGGTHIVTDGVINSLKQALSGTISPQLAWYRSLKDTDLVNVEAYVPFVELDIRYATTNNFMKAKVYDSSKAYLRKGTAAKLRAVAEEISGRGYRLKIWDAYRPPSVQFKMWKLVPDSNYVADPYKGFSNHSRGSAVDLTIVDMEGNELPMPSGFDDFSPKADRNYSDVSPLQAENAKFLEDVMSRHGFKPLATEWWHFDDADVSQYPVAENASSSEPPPPEKVNKVLLTISAIGDNTLGTDSTFGYRGSFPETFSKNGAGYFFSNVKNVLSADDLTIANLETTFTQSQDKVDKSFQQAAFWFKGDPAYAEILKQGSIEAVNLANNHSMDFGDQGIADTKSALTQTGIGYFGYDQDYITEKKGIKIGLLGYNPLGAVEQGTDINALKQSLASKLSELRQTCQLVIVSFHWGIESSYQPNQEQRELGHFAIDQGADLVLGHHPHVIEPIEQYKGKYIVYSLGNFSFGGNSVPYDYDTFVFQQSFDVVNGEIWTAHTGKVIPCSVSSTTGINNYQPMVVSGQRAERVLAKIQLPK